MRHNGLNEFSTDHVHGHVDTISDDTTYCIKSLVCPEVFGDARRFRHEIKGEA